MILLLLAACNLYLEDAKVHYDVPEELEGQVLFVTKGNEFFKASTKAPTTVTSNLDDGFNMAIDKQTYHYNQFIGEFTKEGQFWKGDCFWPNSDQQYRFFAVYPKTYDLTYVSANSVGQGYTIHASTEDDIVCASLTNPDYKEVNELNFEHIFGKIVKVNVIADEGYNIRYCNVWLYPVTEGDYNLLSKIWSSKTESSEMNLLVNNININAGQTYPVTISSNNQALLIPGKYVIHATWTAEKSNYGYSECFVDRQVVVDIPAGAASTLNVTFAGNAPVVQVTANVENWTAFNLDETTIKTEDISGIGKFTINSAGDQVSFSPGILMAHLSEFIDLTNNRGYWRSNDWKFSEIQSWNYDTSNEAWDNSISSNINKYTCLFNYVGQEALYDSFGLAFRNSSTSDETLFGRYSGLKTDFGKIPIATSKLGTEWRTPSVEDFDYILSTRETGISIVGFEESNVRFTLAHTIFKNKQGGNVSVWGYLIFPDDFNGIIPEGATINNVNFSGFNNPSAPIGNTATFTGTASEITAPAMKELENQGCVFLSASTYLILLSNGFFKTYESSYYRHFLYRTGQGAVSAGKGDCIVRLIKDVPKNNLFSVNTYGEKVRFAPGNLQYQASTNTWRFADHQWDYIGNSNSNISSSYSGWIDLFGWGTSGHEFESNYGSSYMPYNYNPDNAYYGPNGNRNLVGDYALGDWGQNNVINNEPAGTWRTLQSSEWFYILRSRKTTATINNTPSAKYTEAEIRTDATSVYGLIIFPDNFNGETPDGVTWGTINGSSNWGTKCTCAGWETLALNGCVFLPASGYRDQQMVSSVNYIGNYWSSINYNDYYAYCLYFSSSLFSESSSQKRAYGLSVRLVRKN